MTNVSLRVYNLYVDKNLKYILRRTTMKKIVSLALVLCLCLGAALALGSCGLFGGAIPTGVYENDLLNQQVTVLGSTITVTQTMFGETFETVYKYETNDDDSEITLTVEEVNYSGDSATIQGILEDFVVGESSTAKLEVGEKYFKLDSVKYTLDVD